ncbi:unnamed protein product [Phytophthora fragariaefolia]|uniref:Unnamed protein product n=1 Tax=Phytophthora fragariaefolia TaxID=1490495 RepID=A0A9W7D4X8_9STRA|nr:unnamed protein product [Phytophthora fragariaefolia]
MINVFGESIEVDACVVDGCVDEFLFGVDFMKAHSAVMDFEKSEVRYSEAERTVVLPFQTYETSADARIATVRLVQGTKIAASVVMPIAVAVPATDGEQGIFVPTKHTGSLHQKTKSSMTMSNRCSEGQGARGFPVVLVQKKDGEVRFCVDYRALNKITEMDVYPLPRIDETLETLGGALLFSTLDLKAGYWQILVAPEDRDKTAFTTKKGLYRFIRMPFGLTNAPSTFQRRMNHVLRGLTWSTCLVYLDDIVVFTRGGIERHIVELACVDRKVVDGGIDIEVKEVQFCNDLDGVFGSRADIMTPMTKLFRKEVEWWWAEAQEEAFQRIKLLLTTKPVLIYPDFILPFRVVTDASKVGLGAYLMQNTGSGWQPMTYASKVNSETEGKYGITELECMAVGWAINIFRPYLYGRRFTVVTDHAALKWLMTSNNLTGNLHRWALSLQEYEFDVEYRPGSTNVVAGALSRAPGMMLAARGRRRRVRTRQSGAEETQRQELTKRDAVSAANPMKRVEPPLTRREALL